MRFHLSLIAIGLALTVNQLDRSYAQQSQSQGNPDRNQEQQSQDSSQSPDGRQAQYPANGSGQNRPQGQKQGQDQGQPATDRSANPQQGQGQGRQGRNQANQPQQGQGQGQDRQKYPGRNNRSDQNWILGISQGNQGGGQKVYYNLVEQLGRHAHSGMFLAPADDALRAQLKLPKEEGLLVTSVQAGSPAALAGIEPNDVLLRIGGKIPQGLPLGKPEDLEEGLKAAGDAPVALLLLRRGHRLGIRVQPEVKVSLGPVRPDPPSYWVGVSVAGVEPALRAQLVLPEKIGLIALDVVKDGPGARAGVRPHDVLLRLDGEDLTDQDKLIQVVQARGEKAIPLEIVREGKKEMIEITPQRRKSVQVSWRLDKPTTTTFDIVLPGGVLTGQPLQQTLELEGYMTELARGLASGNALPPSGAPPKPRPDLDAATARRLDDLTAQIKELRQAIDALTRAAQVKK